MSEFGELNFLPYFVTEHQIVQIKKINRAIQTKHNARDADV